MVARTHLNFALYVFCLSCYIWWAEWWEFVRFNKYYGLFLSYFITF